MDAIELSNPYYDVYKTSGQIVILSGQEVTGSNSNQQAQKKPETLDFSRFPALLSYVC